MTETYDLTNPDKPTIPKDAGATLDYSESWTAWLALVNDTITSVSVSAESPLVVAEPATFSGGIVSAYIGGGTPGKVHRVTFTINTFGRRTDQRSIYLRVRER